MQQAPRLRGCIRPRVRLKGFLLRAAQPATAEHSSKLQLLLLLKLLLLPFLLPASAQAEGFSATAAAAAIGSSCRRVNLYTLDPTIPETSYGLVAHHVRLLLQPWGVDVKLPQSCHSQLQPPLAPPEFLFMGQAPFNQSTYDPGAAPGSTCARIPGTWLLLSDAKHNQDNLYEELISSWYPSFLLSHTALQLDPVSLQVTYVGGNRKGFLAFQDVYPVLGRYMPWQLVVNHAIATTATSSATAATASAPACLEFERTLTVAAAWSWLNRPVRAGPNVPLTAFAAAVTAHFGHAATLPAVCGKTLLYGVRERGYRRVLNRAEVVDGLRAALPGWTILAIDLSGRSLREQIGLLRNTDIFMFSHGGAGPLVAYLSPGAVALELFPWDFADPMYRNMAVMTGKVYLSWQNANLSNAVGVESMKRSSNTHVDVPALMKVVSSAAAVAANNIGDRFLRTSGEPYMRGLCDWCSEDQRQFACPAPPVAATAVG